MARKKKKSHLPAIIAVIIILLAVGGLIAWAMTSGLGDSSELGSYMEEVGEANKYGY